MEMRVTLISGDDGGDGDDRVVEMVGGHGDDGNGGEGWCRWRWCWWAVVVMEMIVAMMVLMAVGGVMMLATGVSYVPQDVKQRPWPPPAGAGSIHGSYNQNVSRHHHSPGAELHTYTNSAHVY